MYDAADSCKAAARMAAPARALLLRPADDDRGDPIPERLPTPASRLQRDLGTRATF